MGLIFAFAVAAQIHTGADLVAACKQDDTTACVAFVHHQKRRLQKQEGAGLGRCLKGRTDAEIVAAVLQNVDSVWFASVMPNHELTNANLSASSAAEMAILEH